MQLLCQPRSFIAIADVFDSFQSFNLMWTVLHQPVLNVPGFKGANGLPIGLSLIAPRFEDNRLLATAPQVAEVFAAGGWKLQ